MSSARFSEEVGRLLGTMMRRKNKFCPECEHIAKAGEEMCYQCSLELGKEEVDLTRTRRKNGYNNR